MISRRGEASTFAASRSKRALMFSSPTALLVFIRHNCFSTKADVTYLRKLFHWKRMRISGLRNGEDKLYLLMGQNIQGEYVSF